MSLLEQIQKSFQFQEPTDDQTHHCQIVKSLTRELALEFTNHCPEGEELTKAIERLDEAAHWAVSAILRGGNHDSFWKSTTLQNTKS